MFRGARGQTDAVVDARVVDKRVEAPEVLQSKFHRRFARLGAGKLRENEFAVRGGRSELVLKRGGSNRVLVHDYRNRSFSGTFTDDRCADSFGAAGDEDDFSCELEIHGRLPATIVEQF